MILIAITSASLPTKKRILTVCVKLFLEKGYKQTTLAEINEKAGVSYSQFQNIFQSKPGQYTIYQSILGCRKDKIPYIPHKKRTYYRRKEKYSSLYVSASHFAAEYYRQQNGQKRKRAISTAPFSISTP